MKDGKNLFLFHSTPLRGGGVFWSFFEIVHTWQQQQNRHNEISSICFEIEIREYLFEKSWYSTPK